MRLRDVCLCVQLDTHTVCVPVDMFVTESDERTHSVSEPLNYHRVVPGRPHNAQTSTPQPPTSTQRLRQQHLFYTIDALPLASIGSQRPSSRIISRARFLFRISCIPQTKMIYEHAVHMSHTGCSETLLDPPNALRNSKR